MTKALRRCKDRVDDINALIEDPLAGIRQVQSLTYPAIEHVKFFFEDNQFVDSRRDGYRSEAYFSGGLIAFTQLITFAVVVFGGVSIVNASLDLAFLLAYLLYVAILIAPVHRVINFARLYQEGITGFNRFMDI